MHTVSDALLAPNVTLTMRKPYTAWGANTHATLTRFVVSVAIPLSVSALIPPGGPVVSRSTYVESSLGVPVGVSELVPVLEGVGVPLEVPVGVDVSLPVAEGVGESLPEAVGVPLSEGVPEEERVPDSVPDGVYVGVTVEESEGPLDAEAVSDGVAEAVSDGVGEGVGINTPCTYTEVPNAVPALATLSHIKVGKVATAAPQYTLFSGRSPKLTPLLTGAGG